MEIKKKFRKVKSGMSIKKTSGGNLTRQLNLKISKKLLDEVELYSNEFGYNNAQELIREAIRDKIYRVDIVRIDYLEKLFNDKDFQNSIGREQSLIELEELKKRADE